MPRRFRRAADAGHLHAASDADEPRHPGHDLCPPRGRRHRAGPARGLGRAYAGEPFVHVLPFKTMPATRHVRGTNLCLIGVHPSRIPGEAILVSVHRQSGQGRVRAGDPEHEPDAGARRAAGTGPAAAVPVTVTLDDVQAARERLAGQIVAHALPAVAHALGHHRGRDLAEVREPAIHRLVQGARRAEPAGAADAGAGGRRRGRDVGRQPRAGRGLSRPAARHPGHDRDAAAHAVREGREHAPVRRPRRAATGEGVEEAALHAWDLAAATGSPSSIRSTTRR